MTDVLTSGRPAERLASAAEQVAWLTTVRSDGQPQSSPVWFGWDGASIWMRSQAGAGKVANVRAHPMVSFHLPDAGGQDVLTIDGEAALVDGWPDEVRSAYLEKYETAIRTALATTPEQLEEAYAATLRIMPTRARAW